MNNTPVYSSLGLALRILFLPLLPRCVPLALSFSNIDNDLDVRNGLVKLFNVFSSLSVGTL